MLNRLFLRDVKKYKKELNVPFLIFIKKFDIIYIENKEGRKKDGCRSKDYL